MSENKLYRFLSCTFVAAFLLLGGCRTPEAKQAEVKVEGPEAPAQALSPLLATQKVTGKLMGVSQKAGTISVQGESGPEIFRFTDETWLKDAKSILYFNKDDAVTVTYTEAGGIKTATAIEKKLAKLPDGVPELKPEELAVLVSQGPEAANYLLVDSRPEQRFNSSHIPTAVSIPVPRLKGEGSELLPADKNMLVIFYCGGYT